MTIDFVQFVDDEEEIVAEVIEEACTIEDDSFAEEPSSAEAELYSDEPIASMPEEQIQVSAIDAEAVQAQAIRTALDQPVIAGWQQDLDMGPKIAVLGVGGAGCNALGSLVRSGFDAAKMVGLNTDIQDLQLCPVSARIILGAELCRGRGAGGKPEVGALAAQESRSDIEIHLQDVDLAFVVFGAGGGTGSGAGPEICHMARELGCLTVAVVTKPFAEEGKRRRRNASECFEALKRAADSTVVVANDHIDKLCNENDSVAAGFETADGVLRDAVLGMVRLAQAPATGRGKLNVDFQDVRTVMEDRQNALIGIGVASGGGRANEALDAAVSSPLLEDATLEGATGVLCHIRYGSEALTMRENRQINALLSDTIDEDAEFITGFCHDPSLGDEIAVLVVATGFDMNPRRKDGETGHEETPVVGAVRPAKVKARAEVSGDWRLGTAAERHQQRVDALAKRREESRYQAPPSRVASTHIEDHNIRRTGHQSELGLEQAAENVPVATQATFNAPKVTAEQPAEVAGFSVPALQRDMSVSQSVPQGEMAIGQTTAESAASRRANEGRPATAPSVQFAPPEIDPGDERLFGFAGTDDGEPSGQYIENLTSLMPQPAAVEAPEPAPQFVPATTAEHKPFAMTQAQGREAPVGIGKQMIQADPVQLERTGQQNLLGIDDDVDVPPFLRR